MITFLAIDIKAVLHTDRKIERGSREGAFAPRTGLVCLRRRMLSFLDPSLFVFASSFLHTTFTQAVKAIPCAFDPAKRRDGECLVAMKTEFLHRWFHVCPLFFPSLFLHPALVLHASFTVAVPAVLVIHVVIILGDRQDPMAVLAFLFCGEVFPYGSFLFPA